jgi:hypothetical protein
MGGEPSRFRKLVHSLERVRGNQVAVQACPLEQDCRHMQEALRADGVPAGVMEEFRILAALRNGRRDRPYFRTPVPLAVACPGARGRVACLLSIGENLSSEMPQQAVAMAGGVRAGLPRSPAEQAPARPAERGHSGTAFRGTVRPAGTPFRGQEAAVFRPAQQRVSAKPAPSIPSAPRRFASS